LRKRIDQRPDAVAEAIISSSPEAHADFMRITERLPFRKDVGGYG
jgi:hypothetical protein